jgi:Protein of unknown function (DUF3253)
MTSNDEITETILRLAGEYGGDTSFSPSDVARALAENWRPLLTRVRNSAQRLSEAQRIDILRHGKVVPPEAMRGVIRLRLKTS